MGEFIKGRQRAWFHDEGHPAGFFHTYDALQLEASGNPRKVHVFLPRDYETSSERYPVLYTNDGDTTFFAGGILNQSLHLGETLSDLYQRGLLQKIIVVAVYPINREREYTHAPVLGSSECCQVMSYATYLAKTLKPFIDDQYRTVSDAASTLIAGYSHGGLAAFYTATQFPQQFGLVSCQSASFWVGLDSTPWLPMVRPLRGSKLINDARPTLQNPDQRLKIYLDWGLIRSGGFHNSFIEARATVRGQQLRDLLVQQFGYTSGKDLFVVEDSQGYHSESSWETRIPAMLQFFFGTEKSAM